MATQTPAPPKPFVRRRVQLHMPKDEKIRTKQQFKNECDINNIMAKYQKTGAVEHMAAHQQHYGYANSVDFNEAMQITTRAEQMFAALPSSLRTKFRGDPGAYLDFVQDEANYPEMAKLGLLSEAAEAALETPPPSETPPEDTTPPEPTTGGPE